MRAEIKTLKHQIQHATHDWQQAKHKAAQAAELTNIDLGSQRSVLAATRGQEVAAVRLPGASNRKVGIVLLALALLVITCAVCCCVADRMKEDPDTVCIIDY